MREKKRPNRSVEGVAHRSLSDQMRRQQVQVAMPIWADRDLMVEKFIEAVAKTRITGIPHEVDHIVPLKGKNVSGLHVHHNLQVLTKRENQRKTNRFEAMA